MESSSNHLLAILIGSGNAKFPLIKDSCSPALMTAAWSCGTSPRQQYLQHSWSINPKCSAASSHLMVPALLPPPLMAPLRSGTQGWESWYSTIMLTTDQSIALPFIPWDTTWLQFPATTRLRYGSWSRADWDGQYLATKAKSEPSISTKKVITLRQEETIS